VGGHGRIYKRGYNSPLISPEGENESEKKSTPQDREGGGYRNQKKPIVKKPGQWPAVLNRDRGKGDASESKSKNWLKKREGKTSARYRYKKGGTESGWRGGPTDMTGDVPDYKQ